jgi:hypothetical protein
LQFLITIVTAAFGAIGIVARKGNGLDIELATKIAAVGVLPVLLVFAFVTFLRVLRRNRTSDDYKERLAEIRFRFGRRDAKTIDLAERGIVERRSLWNGGLAVMTLALLTLLSGAWFGAIAAALELKCVVAPSILLGFAIGGVAPYRWLQRFEERDAERRKNEKSTKTAV